MIWCVLNLIVHSSKGLGYIYRHIPDLITQVDMGSSELDTGSSELDTGSSERSHPGT